MIKNLNNEIILYPDYVFKCRKCEHLLFTSNPVKILGMDCPKCGEEFEDNFVFVRMGNYDKEYPEHTEDLE